MRKIALITIHHSNNYGAMLQTYATKYSLSKFGEVDIINYQNEHLSNHLHLLRIKLSIRGMKMILHDILRLPFRLVAVKRFKGFMFKYFNLTIPYSNSELINNKFTYDIYVCGSDQIWNPSIVNEYVNIDPIYFLSFAPKSSIKISYASSIGSYVFNHAEKIKIKKLLTNFRSISLREEDGVEKIQTILKEKEITHVLDPTLLLSKAEWMKVLDIRSNASKEKYILLYTVPRGNKELVEKTVSYYKEKLKMKVITIDQMLFPLVPADKHIRAAGLKEYITLFNNASFVITNSFHGTCFSINFEIPFVSVKPPKGSNRIESLFKLLKMENRLIDKEISLCSIKPMMNFNQIQENLQKQRKYSLRFLEESITT